MPSSKQAKKRVRKNEEQRAQNKTIRTSMRSAMKKVLAADTAAAGQEALPQAMKRIDKAAKLNIIHDNAAARYKSHLARSVAAKG